MGNEKSKAIMLSIREDYRDRLRMIAAEANLKNPSTVKTASGIARDIVCEFLDRLEEGRSDSI